VARRNVVTARERMLSVLRVGLRGTTVPALPEIGASTPIALAEQAERFAAVLTKIGGRVDRVRGFAAAAARVYDLLVAAGGKRVALSDAPELVAFATAWPAGTQLLPHDALRDELLAADAGVTFAQHGIAETGTLVLLSSQEQNRLASLLPAVHIAVLPVSRLFGSLGEAFAGLQGLDGAPRSRTITFVTGPSRTADIELTLVVGVHGPKALHVVLVYDA
jgi:L-lactate dehydrogenase complex protein LldG